MERLPFVDEHSIAIDAPPERVWSSLTSFIGSGLGGGLLGAAAIALDLHPRSATGDWSRADLQGNAIPGFEVAESARGERVLLRGHHRFSSYALEFKLAGSGQSACTLSAVTWAEFPGISGRCYRAAVIGSRGHRTLVRRMLRTVAARA
jgi:hypothetical protein